MSFPKLYPIANITELSSSLDYVTNLILANVEMIQLRTKSIEIAKFSAFTAEVIKIKNKINPNCKIIINDFVEVAKQADGVHLGQQDLSPIKARELLGSNSIIGLSTHNLEQIGKAPLEVLNYIALGPIFDSKTKSGHAPLVGLASLKQAKEITKKSSLPLVAIGGIDLENVKEVYLAGADSIACISDLKESKDLKKRIIEYKSIN